MVNPGPVGRLGGILRSRVRTAGAAHRAAIDNEARGGVIETAERLCAIVSQGNPPPPMERVSSTELANTKFCLANPGTGYLVYQPKSGETFSV